MVTATHPATDPDQQFWWDVLSSGSVTTIPRWVRDPVPGMARLRVPIPDETALGLRRLARTARVSQASIALAAHAMVLAALSGEHRVTTGWVARAGGRPLPCRIDTDLPSWRSLVLATERAASLVAAHDDRPVAEWAARWSIPAPLFETVCDSTGGDPVEPAGDVVLAVELCLEPGAAYVVLRYRGDVLDAEAAARVAGYHVTALRLIATDPGATPGRQSLLSAHELRHQLDELAGPDRERPDRRVHELFEERAAAHPDRVAAVRDEVSWTYRELNARANQLARALRTRGLDREDVVAVVTERTLDWMAAVLAVFKAGGVYLPIEPHFPADRIATMISRAGCRLVLTEPGSAPPLDADGPPIVLIEQAYREGHADDDLGIEVAADQLAYIYFTSGSTGQPKGAMCEHAGLLNHVFAKIEDLGVDEAQVVAQTAPQCFDISLWQLISALLVGGRTVLIEQETILDVARFVETVVAARVTVLQLVPSYLEVVLGQLARHPRELSDLRCVSVTGEAVKKQLTQRWFAQTRGIALVNAYGLTETCDDTNHEVMLGVPDQDRVPLGRPVPNVRIYIVDERLQPVPLGSAGEIVFSGVCVGRGYVNDPERTRAAFVPDPHRPGERLYRSGDQGRWLPDGRLEFLGRRDTQVKIRGFRIEIGEIDNALLRVPGVGDGAVVVAERAEGAQLVAFYTGPHALPVDELRDVLGATLPAYMVPTAFHRRQRLPLTGNSKIDRKALVTLAAELARSGPERSEPATPTERRLAAAWATVLGVASSEIGRTDHFFDLGGTSLSAVKLAIALDREVGLPDITRHPTLSDLARLIDERPTRQRAARSR